MKIHIDVDITPQELRTFLGLPDVEPMQREMLDKLRAHMESGAEGLDPTVLMKPFLAPDLESVEAMQRAFWQAFSTARSGAKPSASRTDDEGSGA